MKKTMIIMTMLLMCSISYGQILQDYSYIAGYTNHLDSNVNILESNSVYKHVDIKMRTINNGKHGDMTMVYITITDRGITDNLTYLVNSEGWSNDKYYSYGLTSALDDDIKLVVGNGEISIFYNWSRIGNHYKSYLYGKLNDK